MKSPWSILGIRPTKNKERIIRAWRQLAVKHHPDHGGDLAKMTELNVAKDLALKYEPKPKVKKPTPPWEQDVWDFRPEPAQPPPRRTTETYEVSEGFLNRAGDWRLPAGIGLLIGGLLSTSMTMFLFGLIFIALFNKRHRDKPIIIKKGKTTVFEWR